MRFVAEQASKYAKCVEIGVWKGRSTACMAEFACGEIWAVDHFEGTDGLRHSNHKEACTDTDFSRHARANLAPWIEQGTVHLIVASSVQAAEQLAKYAPFDFIYIDGDHSTQGVLTDIQTWRSLLSPCGLLAGHDEPANSVTRALNQTLPGWRHVPGSNSWLWVPSTN